MRRIALYLAMATIFLATLAVLFAQEQVAAPVYKDGDYWWYRIAGRIYELTIIAGKLKIFDPKPDQKIEVEGQQAELLGNLIGAGQGQKEFLEFPLSVGKKWTARYDTGKHVPTKRGTQEVMISVLNQVTGIEDVTTPAGSFRAFKIERREIAKNREVMSGSVYYSPETRSVVKYEYGRPSEATRVIEPTKVIELTKYGTAQGN